MSLKIVKEKSNKRVHDGVAHGRIMGIMSFVN
jgi:hypothetical protein